jgi:hypothetical protein
MTLPKTAKPATAADGEPASNFERLGGELRQSNTLKPAELQARWLTRRFAIDPSTAAAIVPFVFGGAHAQNSP